MNLPCIVMAMYVETIKNRNSPPAILVRESFRQNGKVRKRTLANLSKLPPGAIEALRRYFKGETGPNGVEIIRSLPHGHVAAALGALRNCGLDTLIDRQRSPERDRVCAMIVARILDPGSKLATARGLAAETARDTLAAMLDIEDDVTEDELHDAMDWLLARKDPIERRLARRHLEEGTLVLYDLTSVWMEGRHCPLARFGHSRDGKRGKMQIEFGLLCDRKGWPVALEVFDGNTADPATVATRIDTLRRRFGLTRVVLVGDRGMLTSARIREDVKPAGLDWISALRAPAIKALVANGALQPSLFDSRDIAEITCPELYPGERLVVCRNPQLAAERARKRQDLLAATERTSRRSRRRRNAPNAASRARTRSVPVSARSSTGTRCRSTSFSRSAMTASPGAVMTPTLRPRSLSTASISSAPTCRKQLSTPRKPWRPTRD